VTPPAAGVLDLTSPLRPGRRGAPEREGFLLRFDRLGGTWEMVAGGLRNAFGIAAHPGGDLFSFDSDRWLNRSIDA